MSQKKIILAIVIVLIFVSGGIVYSQLADKENFIRYNPDGDKFQFASSFIKALSQLSWVRERESKESPLKSEYLDSIDLLKSLIQNRIFDNTNLRTAKNLIRPYLTSKNGLIRKTAKIFIEGCDEYIGANSRERVLLLSITDKGPFDRDKFMRDYHRLETDQKELSAKWVESAVLFKTILISAAHPDHQKFKILAVTQNERHRLIGQIDDFYSGHFQIQIKAGQSYIDASVAALRDILESPQFKSIDQAPNIAAAGKK